MVPEVLAIAAEPDSQGISRARLPDGRARFVSNYRPEMDGLRAIACLIVLVCHALGADAPSIGTYLRGVPKIGVWLFFVLSAFLLSLRLLDAPGGRGVVEYAVARLLRIVPLFVLAVVFYRLVGTLGIETWRDAVGVLTFRRSAKHLWTIPPELAFYVVLPFVVRGLMHLTSSPVRHLALLLVGIIGCAVVWPPFETPENSLHVGWYLPVFGAGIAAALVTRSFPHPDQSTLRHMISASAMMIVGLVIVGKLLHGPTWLLNKGILFSVPWGGGLCHL